MKSSLLLFGSLLFTSAFGAAPLPAAAATVAAVSSDADRDWQAIAAARQAAPDNPLDDKSSFEKTPWQENRARQIYALGSAFISHYPEDPRRWQIMADLLMDHTLMPTFVTEWGPPNAEGEVGGVKWDTAAQKQHWAQRQAWKAELSTVPGLPAAVREFLAFDGMIRLFTRRIENGVETWDVPDFPIAATRAKVLAFGAEFPDATRRGHLLLTNYVNRVRSMAPATETEEWKMFKDSPNSGMARLAQAQLRRAVLFEQPLDIAFTAIDGRPVDLKQLRGKVVLIDFWATWCGPCIAEIPNVLAVYQKYHAQGFEVIGVALEMAELKDNDTPEQRAAKVAKTKQTLAAFTATRGMGWPQYFDERHPKNDLALRYEVASIPAMFLLDQDGRVVSTDARGPKLEAAVKRLLKL